MNDNNEPITTTETEEQMVLPGTPTEWAVVVGEYRERPAYIELHKPYPVVGLTSKDNPNSPVLLRTERGQVRIPGGMWKYVDAPEPSSTDAAASEALMSLVSKDSMIARFNSILKERDQNLNDLIDELPEDIGDDMVELLGEAMQSEERTKEMQRIVDRIEEEYTGGKLTSEQRIRLERLVFGVSAEEIGASLTTILNSESPDHAS